MLGDVHGNAVALAAVLEELRGEQVELVVWTGDLTWGHEPRATVDLVRSVEIPSRFVRGNAERALLELRECGSEEASERERWMLASHAPSDLALLRSFAHAHSVEIEGLGAVYFTHGSPRSDEELLTAGTPEARVRAATADIAERVLVTGHTHSQYDREVAGVRAVNPGSVGLPYEGRPGAYWALLGPGVEHRRTDYDLDAAELRIRAGSNAFAELTMGLLRKPPSRLEAIEHAEGRVFSG